MLLNIHPDRIGHGTFLNPSVGGTVENIEFITSKKIPLGTSMCTVVHLVINICMIAVVDMLVNFIQSGHFKFTKVWVTAEIHL